MIAKWLVFLLLLTTLFSLSDQDPTRPQPLQDPSSTASAAKNGHQLTQNPPEKWELNYILFADHRHLASINTILMHEGQMINNWTLVHINPDSVDLIQGHKHKHLRLFGNSVNTVLKGTQP